MKRALCLTALLLTIFALAFQGRTSPLPLDDTSYYSHGAAGYGLYQPTGTMTRTPARGIPVKVDAQGRPEVNFSGAGITFAAGVSVTGGSIGVSLLGSPTPTPNATQLPQMVATLQAQNTALAGQVAAIQTVVEQFRSENDLNLENINSSVGPMNNILQGWLTSGTPGVVNVASAPTPDFTKAANASLQLTQVYQNTLQSTANLQLTQVAQTNLLLTPQPSPVLGGGIYYTATPSVNIANLPTPMPSPILGGGVYFTATPQVIVSNPATPDMTKQANAPAQLTQVALASTGNISLGNIKTAVESSASFDLDIWNQMGGMYVPGTYTPVPNQLRNIADNTLNASNRSTTIDTNTKAQATQVAQMNAKSVTMNTGAVAGTVNVGNGVTVLVQPTPNLTQVPSSAQANAQLTPIFNSSNRATTMDTNIQAVATTVAALNNKAATVNTGAIAFAATPQVNAYVVGGVPQAQAALTMIPTPVGHGTPVVPAASGSGQQFCWPMGPRDTWTSYSASVSTTTPVTVVTAAANQFIDMMPSVLNNLSASPATFTIKKGTTTLWSDVIPASSYFFLPPLYSPGGTAAQPYILTLTNAVTLVNWNFQGIANYR